MHADIGRVQPRAVTASRAAWVRVMFERYRATGLNEQRAVLLTARHTGENVPTVSRIIGSH